MDKDKHLEVSAKGGKNKKENLGVDSITYDVGVYHTVADLLHKEHNEL